MTRYVVIRPEMPEDRSIVIVDAENRERAKRLAFPELYGNPDNYIVTPLPFINKARLVWKDSGEVRT